MPESMSARLFRGLFPYAEKRVARRLCRLGLWRKLANYLWVEFLIGRGSVRMWGGKPYWLTVDPTNFCQLHCPFCPTGANRGVRGKSSMSLEHFKKFLNRVGPCVIHMDMMNWGESLLNKNLPDMIAHAKRYGIEVKLDANFNDVSEETVERLVLSGLDVLSVSIDGISQETYGRYRVGGKLDRVLANLEVLVRKRRELGRATPHIIWQFLVFRHNEHEAGGVESFARARGVDQVSFVAPFLPNEPGYLSEWSARAPNFRLYPLPEKEPTPEEMERAKNSVHVKQVPSAEAFHARRFQSRHLLNWIYLSGLLTQARGLESGMREIWRRMRAAISQAKASAAGLDTAPFSGAKGGARAICKWPWAGMAVNPNGSVSPCCSIESESDDFGSAFAQGWGMLWNGPKYRASRRHVRRYVKNRRGVLPHADHVCERCTAIGYANFKFPIQWTKDAPEGKSA